MGQNLCHNLALLSRARVVKLVDAGDSKSPAARRAGSIPAPGTSDFLQIAAIFSPQTSQTKLPSALLFSARALGYQRTL